MSKDEFNKISGGISPSKGCGRSCLILVVVGGLPVIFLFILFYRDYTSSQNEVYEKALSLTTPEAISAYCGDTLPAYERVVKDDHSYSDTYILVDLNFERPITRQDIKRLQKSSEWYNLGNGKYRNGGLTLEVGSDKGTYKYEDSDNW